MMDEDFADRKTSRAVAITVGEDLSTLSEADLHERISALKAEIVRTQETVAARGDVRSAADAIFKS
ncbi:DUF1192 domain-containing protein [Roseibium sp.]|uniref:DUF1192 domain-containing protein n=1 Tax=Roseibium sp. TaxID=1936156 RepID=UPI003A979032